MIQNLKSYLGKRIFIYGWVCDCHSCTKSYNNGIILDEYKLGVYSECVAEGTPLKFFSNKKNRDTYECEINNKQI